MSDNRAARRPTIAAAASILALALIEAADYGLSVYWLSDTATAHPQNSASLTGLWLWQVFTRLVTPLLGLVVARGVLAYLREAHGLAIPRWGWPVYLACVLVALPGNVLPPLFTVLSYSGPLSAWLADPARMQLGYALIRALGALSMACVFAVDGLMAGLVVIGLRALRRRVEPVLAAITAGLGMVTLVRLLSDGLSLAMRYVLDPQTAYDPVFVSALNTFSLGFQVFTILLLLGLAALLIAPRRPGPSPA